MSNQGIAGQALGQLKGLGEETAREMGQAGEEIVKGVVNELVPGVGGKQTSEMGNGVVSEQQTAVRQEVDEEVVMRERQRRKSLERVRGELEQYRNWRKKVDEELEVREERQERDREMKEKMKKKQGDGFWQKFLGRTRSKYAGTGEMVKTRD